MGSFWLCVCFKTGVDSPLGQSGQVLLLNLKVSESKLVHVLFDSLYATESASKLFIDRLG